MGRRTEIFAGAAFLLASLTAGPASASQQEQDAAANGSDEIVVTAPREVREEAKEFFDTVIKPPKGGRFEGQMARVTSPVCPAVFGLSDASAEAIEKRMKGVALAAELQVGDDKCEPNLFVVMAKDGPELIRALRSRSHRVFGDIPIRQRQKLQSGQGPVYGWKVIEAVPAGSTRVRASSGAAAVAGTSGVGSGAADTGLGSDAFNASSTTVQSLYRRSTEEGIAFSVLLIEHDAVAGVSLKQLADFAAIYSLMDVENTFDAEKVTTPTILSLFEDRKNDVEPQEQVTVWDLTVVHALYNSPANVSAKLQQSAMLQQIEKSMEAEARAAEAAEAGG